MPKSVRRERAWFVENTATSFENDLHDGLPATMRVRPSERDFSNLHTARQAGQRGNQLAIVFQMFGEGFRGQFRLSPETADRLNGHRIIPKDRIQTRIGSLFHESGVAALPRAREDLRRHSTGDEREIQALRKYLGQPALQLNGERAANQPGRVRLGQRVCGQWAKEFRKWPRRLHSRGMH